MIYTRLHCPFFITTICSIAENGDNIYVISKWVNYARDIPLYYYVHN